jgi:hypothetical protein
MAALVPAPRANLVRHSGILAPGAAFRRDVIPKTMPEEEQRSRVIFGWFVSRRIVLQGQYFFPASSPEPEKIIA